MNIKKLSLGDLGTNCYIVSKNNQALIFDPGGEGNKISEYLSENKLKPIAILLTHAHFDHIGAVDELRKKYHLDVYLHEAEKDWLADASLNRSYIYFGEIGAFRTSAPDKILTENTYQLGDFEFEVVHTPGHSPGSVTFIFRSEQFIISGDVLFHHGIGRTDLPGGSIQRLANSILTQLYTLPGNFTVYPGHGEATTIDTERQTNPYTLQFTN